MATKIFSSRADIDKLAYADTVARAQYGMSYGQYCGSVLLDAVNKSGKLPDTSSINRSAKADAIATIKSIATRKHDGVIGSMSDEQIKDLIASRYE